MSEMHTGWRRLFEGIADLFITEQDTSKKIEQDADVESEGFSAAAEELEMLLAELHRQADARREESRKQAALAGGTVVGLSAESAEEVKQRREAEVHSRVRKDVLSMHTTLGTGIEADTLPELAVFMNEMLVLLDASPTADVETYIRGSVVRKIFRETGPLAWSRLEMLMQGAGIEWPNADPSHAAFALAEAEEMFLHAPASSMADLMVGIVRVWRDHYPVPGSILWNGLCIRACGAAIRVGMMREAIQHLRVQSDAIKAEGESLLEEQVRVLQNALSHGVTSLSDAEKVFSGATGLLESVIPDLCWNRARRVLEAE